MGKHVSRRMRGESSFNQLSRLFLQARSFAFFQTPPLFSQWEEHNMCLVYYRELVNIFCGTLEMKKLA